jgi:hypothetical protein
MSLNDIADVADLPAGMRPYFLETSRAIYDHCEGDVFTLRNVLPMLIMLIRHYEIYTASDEMAVLLVQFFRERITYRDTPFGLSIPEFHCRGEIHHNDRHATFLTETWKAFTVVYETLLTPRTA